MVGLNNWQCPFSMNFLLLLLILRVGGLLFEGEVQKVPTALAGRKRVDYVYLDGQKNDSLECQCPLASYFVFVGCRPFGNYVRQ